jgi:hypothetical protein
LAGAGRFNRPFCSEISAESGEPIGGTASRVEHWLLVEYRGLWSYDALAGSGLSDQVKAALRARVASLRPAKLLFIRRRERRDRAGLTVFFASSTVGGELLAHGRIDRYEELIDLDLAGLEPVDHPLFLVCTHGKHDRCCALYGRPLYDVLSDQAGEDWVWQTTHVGGDRFAGNVVVLPEGLYYGRIQPEEAWTLLDEHLARRIYLTRFRGRSTEPFAAQAAEIVLRRREKLTGLDEVRAEQVRGEGHRWEIRLAAAGRKYDVEIDVEPGPLTYLTCAAESLRHPPRFVARSLRESGV